MKSRFLKIIVIMFVVTGCSKPGEQMKIDFIDAPVFPYIDKNHADLEIINLPGRTEPLYLNIDYIEKLPNGEITAYYPYLESRHKFRGFPLFDFMKWLGMRPDQSIKLYAKDGYSVLLTPEIMNEYKHWLTYKQDGKFYNELLNDDQRGLYALVLTANLSVEVILSVQYQLIWLI